jgi:hypothetical protein
MKRSATVNKPNALVCPDSASGGIEPQGVFSFLSKAPVRTFLEEGPTSARLIRVGAPIQFHPFADIFPLLEGEAFAAFVENVKANDLLESIVVFKGKILDGRNRYRACLEAGIEPDFVDNSGDDPLNDVLSWNLHRRHLNESQRAWIEAKIANMPRGTNQHAQICAPSQDDAAATLNGCAFPLANF